MLGEVAGAEEAGEDSAARRGRGHEEREGVGLGEAGVEHGVGVAGSRVLGLRVGVGNRPSERDCERESAVEARGSRVG